MTTTTPVPDYGGDVWQGREPDDRDFVSLIFKHVDYEAQFTAIHALLRRNRRADAELSTKISAIDAEARQLSGWANERAVDEYGEHLHLSCYQDAAHSMAAAGMLAPLLESMFKSAFAGIRALMAERGHRDDHVRPNMPATKRWDCQWWSGESHKNIVRGIGELSVALGLNAFVPSNLATTLGALFAYRNKMFHLGFEWPPAERKAFTNRIETESWPKEWFSKATSGDEPWIFYLTDAYVDHCAASAEELLDGLGRFVRQLPH